MSAQLQLQHLKNTSPQTFHYLSQIPYDRWLLSEALIPRYGTTTNNYAEHPNNTFLKFRRLPIFLCFREIYIYISSWMFERRSEIEKKYTQEEIVECWKQKIFNRTFTSRGHEVKPVSEHAAYVTSGQSALQYVVNLTTRSCSCRIWNDQKVLCSHAIRLLTHLKRSPPDYVDHQFLVFNLLKIYSIGIPPIDFLGLRSCGELCLVPPAKKKRGRPKVNRIASRGENVEKGNKHRCGHCHRNGHNIRSCPEKQ
jgi:zinc finger SWIM domain-containing protein 3